MADLHQVQGEKLWADVDRAGEEAAGEGVKNHRWGDEAAGLFRCPCRQLHGVMDIDADWRVVPCCSTQPMGRMIVCVSFRASRISWTVMFNRIETSAWLSQSLASMGFLRASVWPRDGSGAGAADLQGEGDQRATPPGEGFEVGEGRQKQVHPLPELAPGTAAPARSQTAEIGAQQADPRSISHRAASRSM